jgi:hypothetical protein
VTHLLDVNVLVALFDPQHIHHDAAHRWFSTARVAGWATCPITENGLVRVIANPAYPGRRTTVADAADRLARFTRSGHHARWPADVSVLDPDRVDVRHLTGHREITDAYLLALAVRHRGALATFDRSVRTASVAGFTPEYLVVLDT